MPRLTTLRLRRLAISAFLVAHLAALVTWNLPASPLRALLIRPASFYMLPTGLWQSWSMFAPDPMQNTITLEAIAADRAGIMYNYAFPKMLDFPFGDRAGKVRHSKYVSFFAVEDFNAIREMAARHVVRHLEIPPRAFPVELELQYRVRATPPPGTAPDPMASTVIHPIKGYRFNSWKDAQP